MPWFKVDDTLHGHPKARRAGLPAMGMWVLAGSFSAQYATDGFIAEQWVAAFPKGRRLATELVFAGLWVPGEKDGENGWVFHDWLNFQPSKVEIEADRAAASERQRRWRTKRRDAASGKFGPDSNGVTDGVTNDVSHGGSNTTPTRPDPTRPDKYLKARVETPNPNRPESDARTLRDELDLP